MHPCKALLKILFAIFHIPKCVPSRHTVASGGFILENFCQLKVKIQTVSAFLKHEI